MHTPPIHPTATADGSHRLYDVKITALRQTHYTDLQQMLENDIADKCSIAIGQTWISHDAQMPGGMCPSAWQSMQWFVAELAAGRGDFYNGWMRNPHSALISCNDGFRPVSFLLERV